MTESPNPDPGKILLAVDGSPSSRSAAYAAAKIAFARTWSIHALYVVDIAGALGPYTPIDRELSELGNERPENEQRLTLLEEQGTLALEEVKGICESLHVPLTTELVAGDIPTVILDSVHRYNLLALGRRGNRHKGEFEHLGSNFRAIAHQAATSLLIGARDNAPQNFQRLLLAYDGSELSRCGLSWTEYLQSLFHEIDVLSVEKEQAAQDWISTRRQEIKDSALTHCKFFPERGEPGQSIASTAVALQMDLVVMGGYHHSHLPEWATHSTLNVVLRDASVPVLAAK